jgi:undecaprenyl-diphosphatase
MDAFSYEMGYLFTFIVALAESLAFVGLFVPGAAIIPLMGFLAFKGYFDVNLIFIVAFLGAISGDAISYYLGRYGSRFFKDKDKFEEKKESYLKRGQRFFQDHGGKSVFFARFFFPLRPVIPFVAGTMKMKSGRFFLWNIVGAFFWTAFYVYLGFFFGHVWEQVKKWTEVGAIVLLAIILSALVIYRRFKKLGKSVKINNDEENHID